MLARLVQPPLLEWLPLALDVAASSRALAVDRSAPRQEREIVSAEPAPVYSFSFRGRSWLVAFNGTPTLVLATQGMKYIHALMQKPGEPIAAETLHGNVVSEGSEIMDRESIEAIRKRLSDIDEARRDAEQKGEPLPVLDEEEQLRASLRSGTGLRGRPRLSGSSRDQARNAVGKAIRTAIKALGQVSPELAAHLRESIKAPSGYAPAYQPEEALPWML